MPKSEPERPKQNRIANHHVGKPNTTIKHIDGKPATSQGNYYLEGGIVLIMFMREITTKPAIAIGCRTKTLALKAGKSLAAGNWKVTRYYRGRLTWLALGGT